MLDFSVFLKKRSPLVLHLFAGPCNSKCVWCPRQYSIHSNYKEGNGISFDDLERFLELNQNWKVPLIPYGSGEPTIHPHFVEYSKYLLEKGWSLSSIHSNLSANLSDDVLQILSYFHGVTVNFGGGNAEIHRRNMGTDFCAVLENLKRLVALHGKVKIEVKMVLNRWNIDSVSELKRVVSEVSEAIKVSTYPLYFAVSDGSESDKLAFFHNNLANDDGTVNLDVPCRDKVTVENGVVKIVSKLVAQGQCYGLNPTVHADGSVTVCCRSRWYGGSVGNAFETPLREIYGSKKYKDAVEKALRREYVGYCKFCS